MSREYDERDEQEPRDADGGHKQTSQPLLQTIYQCPTCGDAATAHFLTMPNADVAATAKKRPCQRCRKQQVKRQDRLREIAQTIAETCMIGDEHLRELQAEHAHLLRQERKYVEISGENAWEKELTRAMQEWRER